MKPTRAFCFFLCFAAIAWLPGRAVGQDWQKTIDDCFSDNTATKSYGCYFTAGRFRLSRSPHDCVMEAVNSAESGNRSSALSWLAACACGDDEGQRAVYRAGDPAVSYALDRYGGFAH